MQTLLDAFACMDLFISKPLVYMYDVYNHWCQYTWYRRQLQIVDIGTVMLIFDIIEKVLLLISNFHCQIHVHCGFLS